MKASFCCVGLLLILSSLTSAQQLACCSVTAVDLASGAVQARVNSNGQVFTFHLTNRAPAAALRVGQPVYANFTSKQVSLDARSIAGTITSVGPAPTPSAHPSPPPSSQPSSSSAKSGANSKPTVSSASGNSGFNNMKVNTPNLTVPEGTTAGTIRGATASPSGGTTGPSASPAPAPQLTGKPTSSSVPVALKPPAVPLAGSVAPVTLPQVVAGPPQIVQNSGSPVGQRVTRLGALNANVLQLRGAAAIQQASGLPQGARDFLLLHARTLPQGQTPNYVVNLALAQQWFQQHPEPPSVHQAATASHNSHTGCNSLSVHCAEEAAKHAADEAQRQAEGEWQHLTGEVAHDWNMAQECFADHTLPLHNIPVKFSVTPEFPLNFEKSGQTSNKYGGASGKVSGSVTFGLPVDANFTANVDMFYIPCLPFAVRPKAISAGGALDLGTTFGATINATGQFNQLFTIPPSGGPHFPIEVIPIVIAGVPVAEMDVSVYVDGTVAVDGQGTLNGAVKTQTRQHTEFGFSCSGNGCDLEQHSAPEPSTATESVKLDGYIHVKPAVYVALQLDFDVDLLSARAGPQPYLLGEIYGCSSTTASQTTTGASSVNENYALTADLDWGLELRAEALVGPDKVGEKTWKLMQHHIAFDDLAHSTALVPIVAGNAQPAPHEPVAYTMKMPDCYPYPDQLEYAIAWTGGANASAGAPNTTTVNRQLLHVPATASSAPNSAQATASSCSLGTGSGNCWGDPRKNTWVNLDWPSPGDYTVTVVPLRDKPHGRVFKGAQAAQQTVQVQQPNAASASQ